MVDWTNPVLWVNLASVILVNVALVIVLGVVGVFGLEALERRKLRRASASPAARIVPLPWFRGGRVEAAPKKAA